MTQTDTQHEAPCEAGSHDEEDDHAGVLPFETFNQWYERKCREAGPDYDPTPYCGICGARTPGGCNCPKEVRLAPLAEEGARP